MIRLTKPLGPIKYRNKSLKNISCVWGFFLFRSKERVGQDRLDNKMRRCLQYMTYFYRICLYLLRNMRTDYYQ